MPRRNSGPRLRWFDHRKCWYIVWTESGRSRERSTSTPDREAAEIALAEFIRERTRGAGPRDPAEVLITDILADYAAERAPEMSAPWRIAYAIEALSDFWEGRSVSTITRETCRYFGQDRGLADGTIRRELGVLRAAINHAHREGRLTRPVPVHLPKSPAPKDRWLTRKEVAALLREACREPKTRAHLPLFILLALYTGQRKEAVLSLRWDQVDLDKLQINFNPRGRAQTGKRRPRIPIPDRLLPHLRRARLRGSETGFVIHRNGRRLTDVKKGFSAACARAGLSGVSPHVLRHTAATWLMHKGVSLWEAAGYLGMTEETLVRVYGHQHPDYLRNAAGAFR